MAWYARWWRIPGEELLDGSPIRGKVVKAKLSWCSDTEWGIAATFHDGSADFILDILPSIFDGVPSLVTTDGVAPKYVTEIIGDQIMRRLGQYIHEPRENVILGELANQFRTKAWVSGKMLRRATGLSMDEFSRQVRKLIPRYVREESSLESSHEAYGLTLPGLLRVEGKLGCAELIEGIYRAVAHRFQTNPDSGTFGRSDFVAVGLQHPDLKYLGNLAEVCLLVGAHPDTYDGAFRMPLDSEAISEAARRNMPFREYLLEAANNAAKSEYYPVKRVWPSAPLWLENDGTQTDLISKDIHLPPATTKPAPSIVAIASPATNQHNMYNIIFTAQDGAWESREFELSRERFLEYTPPSIKARFEALSPEAIAELKAIPTIFAYEGTQRDVRIGFITSIADRGRTIFIEFDFDWDIPPIPFAKLEPLRSRLDLKISSEMSRTHWAVKGEDLLARLAAAGVITPKQSSALTPRADISSQSTWTELGRGGFGTVYRIMDERLGMDFALKVFDPSPFITRHTDARDRFLREAGLLFRLHHAHVIRIHDASELPDGRPYIKMEYFAGRDLQKQVEARPFTSMNAMFLVHRLSLALEHAHDRGIVHRDLKPSNVLVADTLDDLRLIDFGLGIVVEEAMARARLTTSSMQFGSPFAAPELINDPKSTDPRNDVYSIGAIWYWLLSGRSPIGAGIKETIQEFSMPNKARGLLHRCLHPAEKRPPIAEVVGALSLLLQPRKARRRSDA